MTLEQASDRVLDVKGLLEHPLARRQQSASLLAPRRLDVHRFEPTGPEHLGDAAGIVAIRLVGHGREGSTEVTDLQAHDRQPGRRQALEQPGGQRTRLEADPPVADIQGAQRTHQRLRFRARPRLADDAPVAVDDADRRLFQTNVQTGKVRHGHSSCAFTVEE